MTSEATDPGGSGNVLYLVLAEVSNGLAIFDTTENLEVAMDAGRDKRALVIMAPIVNDFRDFQATPMTAQLPLEMYPILEFGDLPIRLAMTHWWCVDHSRGEEADDWNENTDWCREVFDTGGFDEGCAYHPMHVSLSGVSGNKEVDGDCWNPARLRYEYLLDAD